MEIEDHIYMKRYQEGDVDAFAVLYDRYVKKIYRFVYYKIFNREIAEDLVSDAFMKAMKSAASFNSHKGTFSAWLYRIARNCVIDHLRSARDHSDIEDIFDIGIEDRSEQRLDAKMQLDKIEKYLKGLTPRQREIIVLRVWEEMSYKEIAEVIGGTENGAKMAFSRAVKDLRIKFGPIAAATLFFYGIF